MSCAQQLLEPGFIVRAYSVYTQPNVEQLATIAELIDAGKVKVFVHRVFPLEETQAALESHQREKKRGKIVLGPVSQKAAPTTK